MKTVRLLILISSFFLCANLALARVGETEEQCDHRYGKPAGRWDDYIGYRKLYHWHGFDVMVTFVDGVSRREMFNKVQSLIDPHILKSLAKFSGVGRNGIITDGDGGTFTTKEFSEKYAAARTAAWAKSGQNDNH
jgi:hypothetical protein